MTDVKAEAHSRLIADALKRAESGTLTDGDVRELVAYYESRYASLCAELAYLGEEVRLLKSGEVDMRIKHALIKGENK